MEEAQLLVGIIKDGGPMAMAAVMALLWWLERKERQDAQNARNQLLERTLTVMNETSNAVRELAALLRGAK